MALCNFRPLFCSRLHFSSRSTATATALDFCFLYHVRRSSRNTHFPEYVLLDEHVQSQVLKPSYCVLRVPPCVPQCQRRQENCMIFGVSNGLVLYGLSVPSMNVHSYYICNPVTLHWIVLPQLPGKYSHELFGFLTRVESGVLKSYTVVRLDIVSKSSNTLLKFEVFVFEIGEWRNYTVSIEISRVHLKKESVVLNGILHWLAVGHGIIAYDPLISTELIRFITLPGDMINTQRRISNPCMFDACEGKLRYFEVIISEGRPPSFKLWVLNDYSCPGGDNWCILHDISCTHVQHDSSLKYRVPALTPLSFHPFDSDIVYFGYDESLVTYNIKTRKLKVEQKCSTGSASYRRRTAEWWYAILLMIPPWPISIPSSSFP